MKKSKVVVTKNSKELAAALGLSPLDAIEWEVRLMITNKIISSSEGSDLTVTDIAKIAGTSRARITKILKNDTHGISLDVLVRVLGALGEEMKISFKKAA
jgi:predicted XRE-type DNA-binding protein